MKTAERHHLKENELAISLRHARETLDRNRRQTAVGLAVVLAVGLAAGGYLFWQQRTDSQARTLLAGAMSVLQAPVTPQPAPAGPSSQDTPPAPPPGATPGSYPTERAKLEAALAKLMTAADTYPSSDGGIAARYHAAATLAGLGRPAEAAKRYQEVIDRDGSGIYGQMARLGLAEAQVLTAQYDQAIVTYRDLSTRKDSGLPIDAILMELGRAYLVAGKTGDARRTFTRLVDEFPQSPYSAEARRELDALKGVAG